MLDTGRLSCACLDPKCRLDAFHETDIGSVFSCWQSFNVSLFDCRHCGSRWLHYALVDPTEGGICRWYRGPLSLRQSRSVTPENAVEILARLPWYFCGGTDLESTGKLGSGSTPLNVDPVTSIEENDWISLSQ